MDHSLVCKFEQTGSHGAANAAPLTHTLPRQIWVEKELSSVPTVAHAIHVEAAAALGRVGMTLLAMPMFTSVRTFSACSVCTSRQ